MSDDKNNAGGRDRATVSAEEPYEVQHFADQNGITVRQVHELIEKHGNNRDALTEAAKGLRQA